MMTEREQKYAIQLEKAVRNAMLVGVLIGLAIGFLAGSVSTTRQYRDRLDSVKAQLGQQMDDRELCP